MNQYCASVAEDGSVKPEIRSFYERFYQISDTPEAHEEYSQQFTKDGKLIMASTEANGREGALEFWISDLLLFGCSIQYCSIPYSRCSVEI